jgi:uncharacterized membrane protein YraQ (UPF0718 family)
MNAGVLAIYVAAAILCTHALLRRDGSLGVSLRRALEELVKLVPRMICALIGAGFLVKLIPTDVISGFLGPEAGFYGIVAGTLAGLLVPAGPVVAFAFGAAFAARGASTYALVAFVTSWSVFATHRIFIFEMPLLGPSFVRLRMLSVVALPPVAGALAMLVTHFLDASVR